MNRSDTGKALCLGGMAIAGAGLVAGYLSRFWIELDVLRHFTLHFSLAFVALAVACLAARPLRVPVALVLVVAGMIAIGSWSKRGFRPSKRIGSGSPVMGSPIINSTAGSCS